MKYYKINKLLEYFWRKEIKIDFYNDIKWNCILIFSPRIDSEIELLPIGTKINVIKGKERYIYIL